MSTVTSETAQTQFLLGSFGRSLRARNLSPRTVDTYTESVRQFAEFLERQGMPIQIVSITREHVESFIEELLGKWKPATANNRYRGLQTYFGWLVEEGEMISPLITLPLISPNSGLAADDSINRIQEPIGKARNKDGQANQMTLSNNSSIEDWSCSTSPLSNSMPCDERNSFDLPAGESTRAPVHLRLEHGDLPYPESVLPQDMLH